MKVYGKSAGRSVFVKTIKREGFSATPGTHGYAASINKRGQIVVAPLSENIHKATYKKMRATILKDR